MKIATNKIKDIIRSFKEQLQGIYEDSEMDTMLRYCFEEFSGIRNVNISMHGESTVSESELLKYNFAIKDLRNQKPLQYILGEADFYKLRFRVNENVLIPRPETEELVHLIINDIKGKNFKSFVSDPSLPVSILDIGTGSGCIPVALKKNLPFANVSAMDISVKALEIAALNAEKNQVSVNYFLFDILDHLALPISELDIIVSNPPYVKLSEKDKMKKNVLAFEPHIALFVEDDNALLFYNVIADHALKVLRPGGKIYFEINEELGLETKELLEQKGFKNVELIKDINNKNRILRGTLSI
jgi:release factor glutamine methyltransferase